MKTNWRATGSSRLSLLVAVTLIPIAFVLGRALSRPPPSSSKTDVLTSQPSTRPSPNVRRRLPAFATPPPVNCEPNPQIPNRLLAVVLDEITAVVHTDPDRPDSLVHVAEASAPLI